MAFTIIAEKGVFNAYYQLPNKFHNCCESIYNSVIGPSRTNVEALRCRLVRQAAALEIPFSKESTFTISAVATRSDGEVCDVGWCPHLTEMIFISTNSLKATTWLAKELTKDITWAIGHHVGGVGLLRPNDKVPTSRPRTTIRVSPSGIRQITDQERRSHGTIYYDLNFGMFVLGADDTSALGRMVLQVEAVAASTTDNQKKIKTSGDSEDE